MATPTPTPEIDLRAFFKKQYEDAASGRTTTPPTTPTPTPTPEIDLRAFFKKQYEDAASGRTPAQQPTRPSPTPGPAVSSTTPQQRVPEADGGGGGFVDFLKGLPGKFLEKFGETGYVHPMGGGVAGTETKRAVEAEMANYAKRIHQAELFFDPIAHVVAPIILEGAKASAVRQAYAGDVTGGDTGGWGFGPVTIADMPSWEEINPPSGDWSYARDPVAEKLVKDFLTGRGDLSGPELAGVLRERFQTTRTMSEQVVMSIIGDPAILPVGKIPGAVIKGIRGAGALRRGARVAAEVPSTALAVREPVEAAAAEGLRRVPTTAELQRAGFGTTPPPSRVLTTPAPLPATPLPINQPAPYFSDVLEPVVAPSRATPAEMAQVLGRVLPETPPPVTPLGPSAAARAADDLGGPLSKETLEADMARLEAGEAWEAMSVKAGREPFDVYHGSDETFDISDIETTLPSYPGGIGEGIYFAPHPETAGIYGKNIYKTQLNVENPLIIDASDPGITYREVPELRGQSVLVGESMDPFDVSIGGVWHQVRNADDLSEIGNLARDAGHDAVFARYLYITRAQDEILVLDPKVIQRPGVSAADTNIQRLEQELSEAQIQLEGLLETGKVVRPPADAGFGVGWTNAELSRLAKHEGLDATKVGWYDSIDSILKKRHIFWQANETTQQTLRDNVRILKSNLEEAKKAQGAEQARKAEEALPVPEQLEHISTELDRLKGRLALSEAELANPIPYTKRIGNLQRIGQEGYRPPTARTETQRLTDISDAEDAVRAAKQDLSDQQRDMFVDPESISGLRAALDDAESELRAAKRPAGYTAKERKYIADANELDERHIASTESAIQQIRNEIAALEARAAELSPTAARAGDVPVEWKGAKAELEELRRIDAEGNLDLMGRPVARPPLAGLREQELVASARARAEKAAGEAYELAKPTQGEPTGFWAGNVFREITDEDALVAARMASNDVFRQFQSTTGIDVRHLILTTTKELEELWQRPVIRAADIPTTPAARAPGAGPLYPGRPEAPTDVPTRRIPTTEELQRASLGTGMRRVRAEISPEPPYYGSPGLTPQQPSARPRSPLTMGASSARPRPPVPGPQRVPDPDISLYDEAYAGQEALRKYGLPARATRAQAARAAPEAPDTAATIARGGGEIPPGTPVVADAGSLPPSSSKVMDHISFEEPRQRLLDRFRSGLAGLKRAIADDLHPIDRFVTVSKELGSEVSLEENPYIWARLLRGISGKSNTFLEKGTFGKRYWKTEGGRAVPDFKGPGLYQILESVRDAGNHQAFSAYLTSRRAVELADKGIVTGIAKQDALKSIAELDRANPGFRGTAQQVYKYQDDLIEYARESGLLSNDMVARLRTYKDYVPFHRVMDSMETQGFTGNKMANIVSPIKRMVGSERRIINPLESIIKNTHALIEAADRNQVGVMMARMASESPELQSLFKAKKAPVSKVAKVNAKELGIDISGLSEADANMLVDIFRPATYAKGANEVTVMINGQKRFFDVDPDLYKSLTNIDQVDLGLFGKFFGAPARWLRAGAILSPDFMVKNPVRDQLTAFVYSKFGFLPGIDWMKGMGQMLNKSDDYHLYRMSGAEHSNLVSVDRAMTGRTVKEIAEEKGFTDYIKNPVDLLRTLSEVGEKGTRLGEFSRGLAAGESPMAAGFSAREVSQDFSKMGVVTRAVNQIIPFFGANVGGWTRAKTAFTERPIQSSAKAFLGITLPSILLYSINRNDPRYKEIPQWQKDTFWIIPTPNAMLRFPKPVLVGQVFGSVPERFLEFLDERDPEMLTETLKSVVGEGVPGWAPQAVLPFVENATNHNFFLDRPIVPRDREDAPKEMQYSGRTTEAAKALGKWVNLSPAQIDNVFSAYTGGLGRYATDILDPALRATGIADRISDPDPTLADIPVLRSFVVRDPYGSSGVSVDKFYDALKDFEGQEKMYKELIALGRQDAVVKYKDSHPSAGLGFDYKYGGVHYSATARALRRVAGAMSDIRKYQRGVYNSRTMSGAEKRSNIDASNKQLTLLAQKALADLEKILP